MWDLRQINGKAEICPQAIWLQSRYSQPLHSPDSTMCSAKAVCLPGIPSPTPRPAMSLCPYKQLLPRLQTPTPRPRGHSTPRHLAEAHSSSLGVDAGREIILRCIQMTLLHSALCSLLKCISPQTQPNISGFHSFKFACCACVCVCVFIPWNWDGSHSRMSLLGMQQFNFLTTDLRRPCIY